MACIHPLFECSITLRTAFGLLTLKKLTEQDTLLLLEKRVKSRFSHRVWRVTSPLAPGGMVLEEGQKAWRALLRRALLSWQGQNTQQPVNGEARTADVISEDGELADKDFSSVYRYLRVSGYPKA